MGDAVGDGGHGVYHANVQQEVDDRSISAPPVLELTAKVSLEEAARGRRLLMPALWHPACLRCRGGRAGPRLLRSSRAVDIFFVGLADSLLLPAAARGHPLR